MLVTIHTNDMDLAGYIIQSLASYLGIEVRVGLVPRPGKNHILTVNQEGPVCACTLLALNPGTMHLCLVLAHTVKLLWEMALPSLSPIHLKNAEFRDGMGLRLGNVISFVS